MLYGNRIWQNLPGFLKRATGTIYHMCQAIGDSLDQAITAAQKLKAQGMVNRITDWLEYYDSDERKQDLTLHGVSRFVYKRPSELWQEFETRLQQFPDDVKWFGTKQGIIREIERTGLTVDSIEIMRDDPYRWIVLSLTDQCGYPEDQISHIFALGEEEKSVRGTRTFGRDDCEDFVFLVYLSGTTNYSKAEVKTILKLTKPPWTKGYVFFPGENVAEEVL